MRYTLLLSGLLLIGCSKSTTTVDPTPVPPTPVPPTETVTPVKLLDITNRTAVVDAYKAVAAMKVPVADMQWTGSFSNCQPGLPGEAFKKSQLAKFQFMRDMIGLGTIAVSDSLSSLCQKLALAMASSNSNKGFRWDTLACGKNLVFPAHSSNVYCGYDPGSSNKFTDPFGLWAAGFDETVESRRRILNPRATKIGFGEVPNEKIKTTFGASAMLYGKKWNANREFVAWPVAGWNIMAPYYWSFAVEGADFTSATISVTMDGKALDTPITFRSIGTDDNALVWKVGSQDMNQDHTYEVQIKNVLVGGQIKSYTYTVKTINYNEVAFL